MHWGVDMNFHKATHAIEAFDTFRTRYDKKENILAHYMRRTYYIFIKFGSGILCQNWLDSEVSLNVN